MKYSILVKFLIILLTACSLIAAVAGVVGIVAMESAGLYVNSLDDLQGQQYNSISYNIAGEFANLYAAENLGSLSYTMMQTLYRDPADRSDSGHWTVKLEQEGQLLVDPGSTEDFPIVKEYTFAPEYPIASAYGPSRENLEEPSDANGAATNPTSATQPQARRSAPTGSEVPEGYLYYEKISFWEGVSLSTVYLYYYQAPEYTVTVYMQPEVLENSSIHILTGIYPYRYTAIALLAVGLLLFAVGLVYLFWSAGKATDGQIRPSGLNRIPLDLYAVIVCIGMIVLLRLFFMLGDWVENEGPHPGNLSLMCAVLLAMTLLAIGFVYAFAAQIKVKGHYWWHHSVTGFCLSRLWAGIRFLLRGLRTLFRMMPVIWQWLLTAFLMVLSVAVTFLLYLISIDRTVLEVFFFFLFLLDILACIAIVAYGGYAFGVLLIGARKMTQGNLDRKIPTKYLIGSFHDFAEQLNALSETVQLSAQKQMQSERMKSELITNVSHDIKTPLTSIINFVDLLQKPHTPEDQRQYLEVLARQSGQMKRLIEDLMDLSKANTGNMSVSIVTLDAVETVNQALGEFADKLDASRLTPVFRQPEGPVMIRADGRLVWRVLSNLLTNAVKYSLPGTRLYIDLFRLDSQVVLSLKNISREALRSSADELMERFVQGDASRKSEGSGLGLNIARSLMEVQKGQLELTLDGDLFKVTLTFPGA